MPKPPVAVLRRTTDPGPERLSTPRFNEVTEPAAAPAGLPTRIWVLPLVRMVLAKVWEPTAPLLPVTVKVPAPTVRVLEAGTRSVGVARLARLRRRVPLLTVTPPVRDWPMELFTVRVPAPVLVRPEEPASWRAVLLPIVAVRPDATLMVGAVPLRVKTWAPSRM